MEEVHKHIAKLDENLKKVHERIDKKEDLLETLTKSVEKLTIIIAGDEELGLVGHGERIKETESSIKKFEKLMDNAMAIKWFMGVVLVGTISGVGALIYFLMQISQHIALK